MPGLHHRPYRSRKKFFYGDMVRGQTTVVCSGSFRFAVFAALSHALFCIGTIQEGERVSCVLATFLGRISGCTLRAYPFLAIVAFLSLELSCVACEARVPKDEHRQLIEGGCTIQQCPTICPLKIFFVVVNFHAFISVLSTCRTPSFRYSTLSKGTSRMTVTLDVSSDVVGGIVALVLTLAGFTMSHYVYPRLMGRSQLDAVEGGMKVEASTRSINSVRNWLGFWTISLTIVGHLLAFTLEFGLLGTTVTVVSELPSVVLGGGRRFSSGFGSILFSSSAETLPDEFSLAVDSCVSLEFGDDFKMVKNNYPAIGVDSSASAVSTYDVTECTSSWLGSAEWTISPAGNLTIESESLPEQVRYENVCTSGTDDDGNFDCTTDLVISYGSGTSYRGDTAPVVLVSGGIPNDFGDGLKDFAISITEEDGHYVYSMATNRMDEEEFLTGRFRFGHLRCSKYSLGGVISYMLSGFDLSSMFEVYSFSGSWWQSEAVSVELLEIETSGYWGAATPYIRRILGIQQSERLRGALAQPFKQQRECVR